MGVLYEPTAQYNPKPPKCALIRQADIAADPWLPRLAFAFLKVVGLRDEEAAPDFK